MNDSTTWKSEKRNKKEVQNRLHRKTGKQKVNTDKTGTAGEGSRGSTGNMYTIGQLKNIIKFKDL